MSGKQSFPEDFLWGASTAAHQVEGGTKNQWTEWETKHAQELAATAEKRLDWLTLWPEIKSEVTSPDNYISGNGVDHYNRYSEDFALLKKLGMNSFRFGIEWSRIEPKPGKWDKSAIDHYKKYITDCKLAGIEPIVSLWHWTMPVWFTNKGGLEKRSNLAYWRRYIQKIATELDWSDVTYVLTINEANTYSGFGYKTGEWPPQHKSGWQTLKVYYNLALAHRIAVRTLKEQHGHLLFGAAHQCNHVVATRKNNITDRLMVWIQKYYWNWWYLNRINRTQDFVGINFYFTDYRKGYSLLPKNPSQPINDLGWYMDPAGIEHVINEAWRRYKKPILITENGVADRHDQYRAWWLDETFAAMQRSINKGAKLIGYLHWSLLDNFEWSSGWWPQFGLISVDRKTMKRTIRKSAFHYKSLIEKATKA
jgi:beta-glucosidase